MVHVLYTHYKIRKSCITMENIRFDIQKRCVWMLDLLYTCFKRQKMFSNGNKCM